MDRLQGLLDGPKRRAVAEGEGGPQGQAAEMAAEHVDGLLTFLQISGKILELDGKAALGAASPALPILQNAYVSMLRTRCVRLPSAARRLVKHFLSGHEVR